MIKKIYDVEEINNLMDKNIQKLINDTESNYRGQLFKLTDKILEDNKTNMVLIAGPSCAGKTTTARLIKEILERKGRSVITISMDDFFIDRDKCPLLPNGAKDFDSPKAVNMEQMKECFGSLFEGKKTWFPEYDFITGKNIPKAKQIQMKYNSIIIYEGLHVLNPLILDSVVTPYYFRIYVDSISKFKYKDQILDSVNIRLFRRIVRDIGRRHYSVKQSIKVWPNVCDAEEKYIKKFKNKSDSIVNTTHIYELAILKQEFQKRIDSKEATYSQLPFKEIIKKIKIMDKRLLPDTTLMWEFVDPPTVEEMVVTKDLVQEVVENKEMEENLYDEK